MQFTGVCLFAFCVADLTGSSVGKVNHSVRVSILLFLLDVCVFTSIGRSPTYNDDVCANEKA